MKIIITAKIIFLFIIFFICCSISTNQNFSSESDKPIYNLTINITGKGKININPANKTYRKGNIISLEATCDAENIFVQWTGDQLGNDKSINIIMDSDKIINARFVDQATPKYTLTLKNTGYGNIITIPQNIEYYEGTEVLLFPAAAIGFCFDHWEGNLTTFKKPELITMTENKEVTAIFTKNNWTIMIYMDGDNNLEPFAIQDFNEMEAINLSESGINVIVLIDRSPYYDQSNENWSNTRLYKINYDATGINSTIISERLSSYELGITYNDNKELNMGDPKTISNFIDFCKKNYYANNYMLIFWNHGRGWRNDLRSINNDYFTINPTSTLTSRYICYDDSEGDLLYTQEIETGIKGKGLNIIGFDLCYGAMIEVAYQIKNEATYMIASQDSEPGDGWEYNLLLNNFKNSTKSQTDLLNSIINAYQTKYESYSNVTLSAINLKKINTIQANLNLFSLKLYNECTNDTIRKNIRDTFLKETDCYYTTGGYPQDMNIDLLDAAFQIKTKYNYAAIEAQALIESITNAVINEWHSQTGHANTHGLSIHFAPVDYYKNFDINGYDPAYWNKYNGIYPLYFVDESNWVPEKISDNEGKGLLYRLWYEILP